MFFKRGQRHRQFGFWRTLGAIWSWGWTVFLVICGIFVACMGASLIERGLRTNSEPDRYTAAEIHRLAEQSAIETLRNPHVEITEAAPAWPQLWTYAWKYRGRRQTIYYLPLIAASALPSAAGEPLQPAVAILRLSPQTLASLQKSPPPPSYRGLLMETLDAVGHERDALQAHFEPDLWSKIAVIDYGEAPHLLGTILGGLANIAFGIGLAAWVISKRPR